MERSFLVWLAVSYSGLIGLVNSDCTCGIFVLSKDKIPVENIARGASTSLLCNSDTAHEHCKEKCLEKLKTMMKDFHVILQQLELRSVYHICDSTLENQKATRSSARFLYLGGYYKSCEQPWNPTGVELEETVCCKDNAIYSCHPEGFDFRTLFFQGKVVRARRSAASEDKLKENEVPEKSTEVSSSFFNGPPWKSLKSLGRYWQRMLKSPQLNGINSGPTKEIMSSFKDILQKLFSIISVGDEEAIDKQLLTGLPGWLSSFASFYFKYAHELSLGYCYVDFIGSKVLAGRTISDFTGRAVTNDDMSSMINFVLDLVGGNNSKDFIGLMDNVLPLLGTFSQNEYMLKMLSGLVENYFSSKQSPPKKAAPLNAIPNSSDKVDDVPQPPKPPAEPIKHNEVITQFLTTIAKDYLSSYFTKGDKKKPPIKQQLEATENENTTLIKAKHMRQQMYDRTMETVKTVFISVFGMVPGHQPTTQLDAFVSQLMGRTPARDPQEDNFVDDHYSFYRLPLHKQIDDRYYDVAAQDRDGFFSAFSNFNNPKSSWHCLKNYAVNKLFVVASSTVRGLLFNGLGRRDYQ